MLTGPAFIPPESPQRALTRGVHPQSFIRHENKKIFRLTIGCAIFPKSEEPLGGLPSPFRLSTLSRGFAHFSTPTGQAICEEFTPKSLVV